MKDSRQRSLLAAVIALAVLVFCPAAWGQNKNNNSKSKSQSQNNKKQGVNQAAANVQNAQRSAAAAAMQMEAAKKGIDHARDKAISTRNDVVKEHDRAPSLEAARRLWEEARGKLAEASEPVLDKLEADTDYRAAVAERDNLKAKVLKLKNGSAEQARVQKEWSEAATRVSQMEKTALLADPRTKAAMDEVAREEADVKELLRKKEQDIKSDSSLNSATQEIQQAKAALANAQAHYAAELRQLAQARQNLAMKQAQARNNNRNGKNNNRRRR